MSRWGLALLVLLVVLACGCRDAAVLSSRVACPPASHRDLSRELHLRALLKDDPEARAALAGVSLVCFGPTTTGVLVDGIPMLASDASDDALAARLAHLGVHVSDDLGDGCRLGRARAEASERVARALEGRLRARAGLGALDDDAASVDYAARCTRP